MATIKLNIYKEGNKKEIEKTYIAEGYDLMLGTIDDILSVIDVDKLNDQKAVAVMVLKSYGQIKPLLMDVFPGVTNEELNRTKISELVTVFIQIATATAELLTTLETKN